MGLKKVALCVCSNLLSKDEQEKIEKLKGVLLSLGIDIIESPCMYADGQTEIGLGKRKADILNQFYADQTIDTILDVSGGDMANEILPYLDYNLIQKSDTVFWGYSDLTTVLNAIYAKTGKSSTLFQMMNLVWNEEGIQTERFEKYIHGDKALFSPHWSTLQGIDKAEELLRGVPIVGGNIRCFLKLAGTSYFPNVERKFLFLESLGGGIPQISSYFAALEQLGVFNKVAGILLGTFTQLESKYDIQCVYDILKPHIPAELFVAKTQEIGHSNTSKAMIIG